MSRRQIVCVVLFVALVIVAQAILSSPYWKNLSYSPAPYWLLPGVLGLVSILTGVLVQNLFVPHNHRLPLLWSIPLGIASLLIVCIIYLWGFLTIPLLIAHALLNADFIRIIAGVFLGMLVTNQLRKPSTATKAEHPATETAKPVTHG